MLGFDGGQIVAGGNDTPVEDKKVVFARGKDDSLLLTAAQGDASEEDGAMIRDFGEQA